MVRMKCDSYSINGYDYLVFVCQPQASRTCMPEGWESLIHRLHQIRQFVNRARMNVASFFIQPVPQFCNPSGTTVRTGLSARPGMAAVLYKRQEYHSIYKTQHLGEILQVSGADRKIIAAVCVHHWPASGASNRIGTHFSVNMHEAEK